MPWLFGVQMLLFFVVFYCAKRLLEVFYLNYAYDWTFDATLVSFHWGIYFVLDFREKEEGLKIRKIVLLYFMVQCYKST